MFTFEKIWFANPVSAKKPDSIEYVIVYDNQVLFGKYSEQMTFFYRHAKQKEILVQSNNIYNILPLFKNAYTTPTEEEYMKLFNTVYKRDNQKQRERRIHNYHASRYLYTFMPDSKGPKPSHSIFIKFLLPGEYLPNCDENAEIVNNMTEEICEAIEQQALTFTQYEESYQPISRYA